MRSFPRIRLIATVTGLLLGGTLIAAMARMTAEPRAVDDTKSLMWKKLTQAQGLLTALALEDYDQIRSGAEELSLISLETLWTERRSPRFSQLASEFRWSAERVRRMAEEKNLEGATLGYTQMVMSCVECHKIVRNTETTAWIR